MSVKVTCETKRGGAGTTRQRMFGHLSQSQRLFYAGVKLPGGKRLQFFVNQETGLVVVDVINRGGRSGTEIVRRTVK